MPQKRVAQPVQESEAESLLTSAPAVVALTVATEATGSPTETEMAVPLRSLTSTLLVKLQILKALQVPALNPRNNPIWAVAEAASSGSLLLETFPCGIRPFR